MQVFVVEAEHFEIPGKRLVVCAKEERAIAHAIAWTKILQDDEIERLKSRGDTPPKKQAVTRQSWQAIADGIEQRHAETNEPHCYVGIDAYPVDES